MDHPKPAKAAASSGAPVVGGAFEAGRTLGVDTALVHACVSPDEKTGAILTPLYQSTTFVQESVGKYLDKGYSYSRTNNPTTKVLEDKIAAIEHGFGSACVGTGMAATTLVFCGLMNAGDHAVVSDCSYGGTNRICREQFILLGMTFSFVDFRDLAAVEAATTPKTKLLFSETPANPLMRLVDIQAVSDLAKKKAVLHVCDSTFATPVICRPLDHGADLVIQSLTKFYDGHNVGNGGAVISATQQLQDRIKFIQNMHGNIMAPQVSFHILQTMKTMALRVRHQSTSAHKIAEFLEAHPKVTLVRYPGLASHPQKDLADKYHLNGVHGSMLYFVVQGGVVSGVKIMDSIERPWSLCENLGATESIITACAVMTHANMLKKHRDRIGITDGFIRVSVGLEDVDDLIHALSRALDQV